MGWNPSANATLGLEWLVPEEPSSFVLDSAAKAYGQYIPGTALKRSQELVVWADAVSQVGIFGCAVYSAPYVEAIPQTVTTVYAGTDTGAEFTSPQNGGNAWLTQASGAATYASVSPGVDDTTYLRNVNQIEGGFGYNPARLMMRGAGAQTVFAGRRILDIEIVARVKCSLTIAPSLFGCLNISGVDYVAAAVGVPVGQGYNDLSLGKWTLNPSTGRPWTLPDINALFTTGATDEWGLLAAYDARSLSSYSDTLRISSVYVKVRSQPEDRVGYATGQVSAYGWQAWTSKSVPNLLSKQDSNLDTDTASNGTWVAASNTTLSNDTLDPGGSWTRSLKMLSGASGTFGATSGSYPCIPTKTYSVRCFANVTSGKTTTLSLLFYDANGNLLQTSTSAGDVGTGSWAAIGMTAAVAAPSGAATFKVKIETTATAGSQTCYATGIFVGLATTAIAFVRTTSPGGAAATKVDGGAETSSIAHPTDELRVFRRISGPGVMSLSSFGPGASAVGMPQEMYAYRPTLQDGAGALLSLGAAGTDATAFVTTSLAGWDSTNGPIAAYSQPYARRIYGRVWASNTLQAELTLPVETYVAIRLVVAGEVDEPASPLVLKLRKRSDSSQVGGNATIYPTDLDQIVPPGGQTASRTTPQVYVVTIATPAANGAAQHYIEMTSSAPDGYGWRVYAFDTMGYTAGGVSIDTVAFGANTDTWTDPSDGGEQARRNGMIALQTQPTAPTGVTATLSLSVFGIRVAWSGTSLGTVFAATEVWRLDDRGDSTDVGWVQVADLDDESLVAWTDREVRPGVSAQYKLRSRRTDGSISGFSTPTAGVTVPAADCPELIFSSNEASSTMDVYGQRTGDQTYEPPSTVVLRQFFGRDGAVAFLPIENPLDAWTAEVLLAWEHGISVPASGITAPSVSGRSAFDALEVLCRSSLSYVCVRDNEGNRWFANVVPDQLKRSGRSGAYTAKIRVRELTRTPSTPTG